MIAIPIVLVAIAPLIAWTILFGVRQSFGVIWQAFKFLLAPRLPKTFSAHDISFKEAVRLHNAEKTAGEGAVTAEPTTSGFIAGMAAVAEYHAFTQKYLAFSTLEALIAIPRYTVPKGVRTGTKTARDQSAAASRRARVAARGAAAAEAGAISARRAAERAASQAKLADHTAKATAGTVARPLPRSIPDVWRKEQEAAIPRWINKHLTRLAEGLAAAVGVGIVVRALTRHLPWFRCNNVDRLARGVCRMDRGLLDSLLADTLLIAGGISLVTFAREVADLTDETTAAISWFVRELHDVR